MDNPNLISLKKLYERLVAKKVNQLFSDLSLPTKIEIDVEYHKVGDDDYFSPIVIFYDLSPSISYKVSIYIGALIRGVTDYVLSEDYVLRFRFYSENKQNWIEPYYFKLVSGLGVDSFNKIMGRLEKYIKDNL